MVMARGIHLFPFRTEQLSPSAPMVLGSQGPGRVGRRRNYVGAPRLVRGASSFYEAVGSGARSGPGTASDVRPRPLGRRNLLRSTARGGEHRLRFSMPGRRPCLRPRRPVVTRSGSERRGRRRPPSCLVCRHRSLPSSGASSQTHRAPGPPRRVAAHRAADPRPGARRRVRGAPAGRVRAQGSLRHGGGGPGLRRHAPARPGAPCGGVPLRGVWWVAPHAGSLMSGLGGAWRG